MKREDDEKLWDLLGRAAQPDISPFFARNVLRRVREQSRWVIALRNWFSVRRLVPVSGLAAAILAVIFISHSAWLRHEPVTDEIDPVVARIDPQDYEVVADLDELLASDENNLWDENTSL